jgi:hypothetical protein
MSFDGIHSTQYYFKAVNICSGLTLMRLMNLVERRPKLESKRLIVTDPFFDEESLSFATFSVVSLPVPVGFSVAILSSD